MTRSFLVNLLSISKPVLSSIQQINSILTANRVLDIASDQNTGPFYKNEEKSRI